MNSAKVHLFTVSAALLLLAAVTTSHASVLAYEGFSGAGVNTLGTINGYAPGTSAIGLTGSWSLTSNGNEDVIARNTQDFRGITGGYTPDFVGQPLSKMFTHDADGTPSTSRAMACSTSSLSASDPSR